MLEGFLQWVKAMLDVRLEDSDDKETVDVSNEIPQKLVAETKAPDQKDQLQDLPDRSQDQGMEKDSVSLGELDENVQRHEVCRLSEEVKLGYYTEKIEIVINSIHITPGY